MKYCPKCGKEIAQDSMFCSGCGERLHKDNEQFRSFDYTHTNNEPHYSNYGSNTKYAYRPTNDNPSHLAGIISCMFPVVGLVLYFVWHDEKPDSAQLVCNYMLVGFLLPIFLYIIALLFGIMGM